jgi:hypothetical protein
LPFLKPQHVCGPLEANHLSTATTTASEPRAFTAIATHATTPASTIEAKRRGHPPGSSLRLNEVGDRVTLHIDQGGQVCMVDTRVAHRLLG